MSDNNYNWPTIAGPGIAGPDTALQGCESWPLLTLWWSLQLVVAC